MKNILEIYCDGSCWNKPGEPMGLGIAYFLNGKSLEEYNKAIKITYEQAGGHTTSVMAELSAIEYGIDYLSQIKEEYDTIIIYSDNEFSIKVIQGRTHTSLEHLVPIINKIKENTTKNMSFKWVPRKDNSHANSLSREALDKDLLSGDKDPWKDSSLSSPKISYKQFRMNLAEAYEKEGKLDKAKEVRDSLS